MVRIPLATRDSIPEKQRAVFDALVQQRGNVPTAGPLAIMIHVPELMQRGEDFRAYLRGDDSCGSSTVNRGHEHHRSTRSCKARDGRPRRLGGVQRGGGT